MNISEVALSQIGVKEINGSNNHNPIIVQYF